MSALQVAALLLVAGTGTAVVAVREPARQAIVAGAFAATLALLLFLFQAPDVALSEIVVGMVGVPLMVVLALAKMGNRG